MTTQDRESILAQTSAMAKQALRVLGSAYRDLRTMLLPPTSPRTRSSATSCSSV